MPDENTYGFSQDDAQSLIQAIESRESVYREVTTRGTATPMAVILDAALGVATHALTGATSCLATICTWSAADEEYTETADQITVWNHSEAQDYDADTFGFAHMIDGHRVFMGDCAAMDSR